MKDQWKSVLMETEHVGRSFKIQAFQRISNTPVFRKFFNKTKAGNLAPKNVGNLHFAYNLGVVIQNVRYKIVFLLKNFVIGRITKLNAKRRQNDKILQNSETKFSFCFDFAFYKRTLQNSLQIAFFCPKFFRVAFFA